MEHQNTNTNIPSAENFEHFVNITRLTLERYPKRFHSWSPYDENYLQCVKECVEEIFAMIKDPKKYGPIELPEGETAITFFQKDFEKRFGLHIYVAWGAWAEGYFDNFAARVRQFNQELYADSIAYER